MDDGVIAMLHGEPICASFGASSCVMSATFGS
jgi:hypothetical protein